MSEIATVVYEDDQQNEAGGNGIQRIGRAQQVRVHAGPQQEHHNRACLQRERKAVKKAIREVSSASPWSDPTGSKRR